MAVLFGFAGTTALGGIGVPPRGVRVFNSAGVGLRAVVMVLLSIVFRAEGGRSGGAKLPPRLGLGAESVFAGEQYVDRGAQLGEIRSRPP